MLVCCVNHWVRVHRSLTSLGIFLLLVVVVVFLALCCGGYCSVSTAIRCADSAYKELEVAVEKTLLITRHLLDSLPKDFHTNDQARLNRLCDEIEENFALLTAEPDRVDIAKEISDSQRHRIELSNELVRRIETNETIGTRKTVSACIEGLRDAEDIAFDLMNLYHDTTLTLAAANRLKRAICLQWITGRQTQNRCKLDWMPDLSSSGALSKAYESLKTHSDNDTS